MCADQELIAHDALSALINLTSSITIAARLAKIEGFITGLVRMIVVSYNCLHGAPNERQKLLRLREASS